MTSKPAVNLEDELDDLGASWYCNHDVPNGCSPCAGQRAWEAAEADPDFVSPWGPVVVDLAPFGPAWQDEQADRRGGRS